MQFEDLRSCLMELPVRGPHIVLEAVLQNVVEMDALRQLLLKDATQGNGWIVALVLSVKFDAIECRHNAEDSRHCQALHLAASLGDEATVRLLVRAGADVNAFSAGDNSPLMMARRADRVKKSKDVCRCWCRHLC